MEGMETLGSTMSAGSESETLAKPQCKFFVVRKKRHCRMTVRPGRQYCGEHEPQPVDGKQSDKRVPCPNDPKHTCYESKLEKHLSICNARQKEAPVYIVHNINAPAVVDECRRVPLSDVSRDTLALLINKINTLYDTHVKDNISTFPERPIHPAVLIDFNNPERTETSLRHLRQASSLLWIAEDEGLVEENTCYVELGAGKGQLSYYMGVAWCGGASRVVPVDRAALRHKRERRAQGSTGERAASTGEQVTSTGERATSTGEQAVREGAVARLRADLAHLALERVPHAAPCAAIVGVAKHLCGVATDYALRCVAGSARARGAVLATCCHHRCERAGYVANAHLQELGVSGEELNVMMSVVSWATCGDGRSRAARQEGGAAPTDGGAEEGAVRAELGRRAKALLDWGRVLYLRESGFDARLCSYVPSTVSLENTCIIAKKVLCV